MNKVTLKMNDLLVDLFEECANNQSINVSMKFLLALFAVQRRVRSFSCVINKYYTKWFFLSVL